MQSKQKNNLQTQQILTIILQYISSFRRPCLTGKLFKNLTWGLCSKSSALVYNTTTQTDELQGCSYILECDPRLFFLCLQSAPLDKRLAQQKYTYQHKTLSEWKLSVFKGYSARSLNSSTLVTEKDLFQL